MPQKPKPPPSLERKAIITELSHTYRLLHLALSALLLAKGSRGASYLPPSAHTLIDQATGKTADAQQFTELAIEPDERDPDF